MKGGRVIYTLQPLYRKLLLLSFLVYSNGELGRYISRRGK